MDERALIKELVKRQLLDGEQAKRVLRDAEASRQPAEELLYQKRLINDTTVAEVKSELLKTPYKEIDPDSIPEEVLQLIPKDTSQNYRVVPIEKNKEMLIVGMLHPEDQRAQEALRFIAKREKLSLGVYLVTPSFLASVWRRYSPYKGEIEAAVRELGAVEVDEEKVSLEEGAHSAEEAPVIKIVASTLRQAVEAKASDVHIEPQRSRLRIRFRVDGDLQEVASMPVALAQSVVARVKVLARLRLDETRIPQDGRFRTEVQNRDIDYRVSTFPTPSGEKIALRVLDPTIGLKGLSKLGLSEHNAVILEEAINDPYGMILITGPTGSGKTTTLYSMLQKVNSDEINVVSLEDPVEYFMDGINQSHIRPEIGYTFASGLRQILRQDPDVVMVGEIRDNETASLAVNAALTGHMMLSTLHTNNSVGVVPRLVDLEVPPFLLSSSLNLMLAQRLLSKLCPDCSKKEKAPPKAQEIITKGLEGLPSAIKSKLKAQPPYEIYHAGSDKGCETCHGKGTVGRIGLFEIFKMTRELGELINSGFTEGKLWDEAHRQGIVTLRQDGIIKALEGKVLLEEVLRETEDSS